MVRSRAERAFILAQHLLEEFGDMMLLTGRTVSSALRPPHPYGGELVSPASGTLVGLVGVGGGPDPSADLLCQLDDDPLEAADVAEPVAVLVALQLADELSAAGS